MIAVVGVACMDPSLEFINVDPIGVRSVVRILVIPKTFIQFVKVGNKWNERNIHICLESPG